MPAIDLSGDIGVMRSETAARRDRFDIHDLRAMVGAELGRSPWRRIGDDQRDAFAAAAEQSGATGSPSGPAASTPFGETIAPAFLPLSLLPVMFFETLGEIGGVARAKPYGFKTVRFLSPAPAGARIRALFALRSCEACGPGRWRLTLAVAVEIEGQDKPALVADWLVTLVEA